MFDHHGIEAASRHGRRLAREPVPEFDGRPTLARVLPYLRRDQSYIVATKDHWLAVVGGMVRDSGNTHRGATVIAVWTVVAVHG